GAGGTGGDCAATGAEAEVEREAADIIWVIDNSCSMAEEAAAVQANMNRFAMELLDNGIDVHLVLISSTNVVMPMECMGFDPDCWLYNAMLGSEFGVCIGAP